MDREKIEGEVHPRECEPYRGQERKRLPQSDPAYTLEAHCVRRISDLKTEEKQIEQSIIKWELKCELTDILLKNMFILGS